MPGNLIVTADDFGMSSSVNRAIVLAFRQGWISRASIMANMPGFEEACHLARQHRLEARIGIHLNLSEGRPLTARITCCSRFCDEAGVFRKKQRVFRLSRSEREAVEEEFQAQVQACLRQGIRPAHLDSHHHYHTEWPVGTVAIRVARANRIPEVRLSRNCGSGLDPIKRLYKAMFNFRLRSYGLAATRYFGSALDCRRIPGSVPGDIEVMVHLQISPNGLLADAERGTEAEPLVERLRFLGAPASRACPDTP